MYAGTRTKKKSVLALQMKPIETIPVFLFFF
ncbi:hypothetical protein BSF42_21540 [Flavobacterium sp. ACN6]|nr:hypothetical protein BSF42_21540 [Flavobacterium sp. ACN6]